MKKELKRIFRSRVLIIVLLLLLQAIFFINLFLYIGRKVNYLGFLNYLLSILFVAFLVSKPGKNEFKIAWILPCLILPVFGIILYILYKINFGRRRIKKNLRQVKVLTSSLFDKEGLKSVLRVYPKTFDIASYLYNTGSFPSYAFTNCSYYPTGEEAFIAIKEALKEAKRFIFLEFFIIEPSAIWSEVLDILKSKVAEGVVVKVLFDSLGSSNLSTKYYIKHLRKSGIEARVFMPFVPLFDVSLNNRDHRKIVVIDNFVAFTGGVNISDEYTNTKRTRFSYWKDCAIKLEGKAVRSFTLMFLQLYHIANKEVTLTSDYKTYSTYSLPSSNLVKSLDHFEEKESTLGVCIPYNNDAYMKTDTAENVYKYILEKSHTYCHIITPYLILDNTMLNAIIFAKERGVDVKIIVPSAPDHYITFYVGRMFIKMLLKKGVEVYEYIGEEGEGKKPFIHSKLCIADGNRATCGSVNFDYRSFYHHFEDGVFLYRAPVIKEIEKDFLDTLNKSRQLSLTDIKKLGLIKRAFGTFFKLFSPLL